MTLYVDVDASDMEMIMRYEVWEFSNLPEYKPRRGVVAITVFLDSEVASAFAERSEFYTQIRPVSK